MITRYVFLCEITGCTRSLRAPFGLGRDDRGDWLGQVGNKKWKCQTGVVGMADIKCRVLINYKTNGNYQM